MKPLLRPALSALLVLTFYPYFASADPIPPNRRTTWQGNVGVPGGIPTNRTVYKTLNASDYGNGNNDAAGAVQAAVNACPANQVVALSAGTFRFNSRISSIKNNFTIRGAGPGQTTIKVYAGQAFYFGSADYPYPIAGVAITSGANVGSSTVTVADTSSFTPGLLCHVAQDDPPWCVGHDPGGDNTVTCMIVSRSTSSGSGTVTLNHALPMTFTLNPKLVVYSRAPLVGVGIEDLSIDLQGIGTEGFDFEQAYGCWIKNVEIDNSKNRQMFLIVFNQGTITHCKTTGTQGGTPNHEGIDFYNRGCWNLVEDNICDNGGFPSIVMGDGKGGCVGNVIAYNMIKNVQTTSGIQGAGISFHGGENMYNLIEGNVIESGISGDGIHGGTAYTTILRNWCMARSYTIGGTTITIDIRAIYPDKFNIWYNVIGNILGDPTFPANPGGIYDSVGNGSVHAIYRLGFPYLGNDGFSATWGPQDPPTYQHMDDAHAGDYQGGYSQLDLNVKATLIRHGNYDYFNDSIIWDGTISDHNIPNSYYLSGKPSWFGNLTWPPFDPSNPSRAAIDSIPAGYRYLHGSNPPGGGSSPTPTPGPSPSASPSATPNPTATPGASATPTATPGGSPSDVITINTTDATITSPFVLNSDNTISQAVQTTQPSAGGKAVFHFNIQTSGSYVILADTICPDGGSNSFFVNVDSDPTASMIWNVPVTNGLERRSVNWAPNLVAQLWTLDAGPHDLIVRGREAGAKIGQVTIAPPLPPPTNFRISGP